MPTLFTNARITTMDAAHPRAAALLVDDGKIVRVLDDARPAGLAKDVHVIDLHNGAVVPGLHDCHAHLADTGLLAGDHNLSECPTVESMLRRIETLTDPWLYAGNFEEERIAERRPPSRKELDSVSPGRPVLLTRVDGHSCVVNSVALKALEVEQLEGVERDAEGQPTGRLFVAANYAAQNGFFRKLDAQTYRKAEARGAQIALAAGITTLHNVLVGDDPLEELETIYRANAALPIHVIPKSCTTSVAKVKKLGARVFGGDIFVDGSIGSRTAAMTRDYCDRPGQLGRLYLNRDQLFDLFDEAAEAGRSCGVHAIGDRAIDEAIAAWERVMQKRGTQPSLRPSIDHFEVTTPQHVQRAGRIGLLLSMQPTFDYLWGYRNGMYEERLGPERAAQMNPLKSALRAGCTICGGSDSPVTKLSALLGVHAAVNHHDPDERLTIEEALRAYTSDAAKLAFEESVRGALAPHMAADFAVLEKDLAEVTSNIKDVRVLMTVVGGDIKYP